MRFLTMLFFMSCISGTSIANSPESVSSSNSFSYDPGPGVVVSQDPASSWKAQSATSSNGSEIADGIPTEFSGMDFSRVTLFCAQWVYDQELEYVTPDALVISIYNGVCAPEMDADKVFTIPWGELETELVHPGSSLFVYACTATLPEAITITPTMSIGGYVQISWGQVAPFNGLVEASQVNDCPAYWDLPSFGYPRWSPMQWPQSSLDLAYVLSNPIVANESLSWGTVKSLYR
jgi:hypothetical protein